ncbi:hypothetical protein Patl1_04432 [Pistacia atlantica]|uniref:Uncharacterized protein n=1 Tax=Pistacia atlantica TaxID=434234 RepID=A0ACC1BTU7_9ROSI|nr:hypothetical protein Patl1_04432 [Pistacia atlantica]
MDLSCRRLLFLVVLAFTLSSKGYSQPLVPTIITFGDSAVDVGNNNDIPTLFKVNYPPYGKDFVNHQPIGRFCNGKIVTDFTSSGKNLLIGANFASAGAGYDDQTSSINHAIPLSKLAVLIRSITKASKGSGDFLQNYYVNPILNKAYTPQQYSSIPISTFSSFIKVPSQLKML